MGKRVSKGSKSQDDDNHKYMDIKVIFFFFKMIGLAPFNCVRTNGLGKTNDKRTCKIPVTEKFVHFRFGFVYHVSLIVVDLLMSIICIQRLFGTSYPLKTTLTLTIDLAVAVLGVTLLNALWLFTFIRRNLMMGLLNRLVEVDSAICRLSNLQQIGIRRLHVIGITSILTITWIILMITNNEAYDSTILDWFNDIVPTFVISHFMLQYALMVKLVEIRYRNLNRAIVNLSSCSTIRTFRSFTVHDELALMDCDYFPRIADFRRAHNTLYEIGSDVAEFYSLPILFIISLSCFEIIYNAYFALMPLTLDVGIDPTFILTTSVAWVLVLLIPIGILTKGVDSMTKEMRMTTDAVYKLLDASNLSREDRTELEKFSIELLHREIYFTAFGLFPLNGSLVHSILSSTITYLVILLQFQISTVKS